MQEKFPYTSNNGRKIEFKNVSFKYRNQNSLVLKDVNFIIR